MTGAIADLDRTIVDIAAEIGCEPDNELILEWISKMRERCEAYKGQVEAGAHEIERLRAALKPFSDAAEDLGDISDRSDIWESPAAMNITAGNLRHARNVVEQFTPARHPDWRSGSVKQDDK